MSGRLHGRVAVVTGAGQGVGEGIARRLAAEGAQVVIAARRADTGEPVAASIREAGGSAVCIATDVSERDSVEACVATTVDRFGGLHVMVHNAFGGAAANRVEATDLDRHWHMMSRTGAWGSVFCAQAAYPHLVAAGSSGRLVMVTSPAGVEGSANLPLYAAVKAAQRGMAKSLAREWGQLGITVNCIAPVAGSPSLLRMFDRNPTLRDALEARTPLGRVGDITSDIGSVALFLASDDAAFVTGQTVVCDGGSFLGL